MKEGGAFIYCDRESDRVLQYPVYQCAHCHAHFAMKPPRALLHPLTPFEAAALEAEGKKVRGFCANCNAYVCGPGCAACVHRERKLENVEKGLPEDYKPICVPARG